MGPGDNSNNDIYSFQPEEEPAPDTGSSASAAPAPTIKRLEYLHSNITKMLEPLDDTNWVVWRERIRRLFLLSGAEPYVYGTLKRPDSATSPNLAIWIKNDVYAQILITNNITMGQMVHVTRLNTAHEIWRSLEAIHETKDYQVAIAIQRTLFRECASDGDDITTHLGQLKKHWERLNVLDDADFRITDTQFKTIIASSLPQSWDAFTEPYVGRRIGTVENDPKKLMSSQEFIGILKEEYLKRKNRNGTTTQQTFYTNPTTNNKKSLASRLQSSDKSNSVHCNNCKQNNHKTDDCRWLGQPQCNKCKWFGHIGDNCRREHKRMSDGGGGRKPKQAKQEKVNQATENGDGGKGDDSEIVFATYESNDFCNPDQYTPLNEEETKEQLYIYDWLADCATTSHVTNRRDAFTTFEPLNKTVSGVGNAQTHAKGRGTIKLLSKVNNETFRLTLTDVLYIPTNPQNLLSLG